MSGDVIRGAGATVLGARWQLQLVTAAILAVAGIVMLLDQARAELVVGLVLGAYFLVEGVGYIVGRMGNRGPGRAGEVDALRAGVGLLTAALLFGLSFLEAITLTGVRVILIIGGVPFGVLGLWLWLLSRGSAGRLGFAVANVLVAALGILLFVTQFVDGTVFGRVVVVVAWGAIILAALLALIALVRARSSGKAAAQEG